MVVNIVALLVTLVSGTGRGARRSVQAAADRVLPGELTVVRARTLGAAGGHAVAAALRGEPDAAVRLSTTGHHRPPGEAEFHGAVAAARRRGPEIRALLAAFAGVPLVGISACSPDDGHGASATVAVAAQIDDASVGAVVAGLDRCVAAWAGGRPRGSLHLRLVDPAGPPVTDPALPTEVLLGDAAARATERFSASVSVVDGRADGVARSLQPTLSWREVPVFRERVEAAARDLLRADGGFADPSPFLVPRTRLVPGSASRVRAYVAVAERGSPRRPPTAVVAVTVGRTGEHPTDVRLLPYAALDDPDLP